MTRETIVEKFKGLVSATNANADAIVYRVTDDSFRYLYAIATVIIGTRIYQYAVYFDGEVRMDSYSGVQHDKSALITKLYA